MVPATPRHVGFSRTRNRICVPCTARWTANHWTTREAPTAVCFIKYFPNIFVLLWLAYFYCILKWFHLYICWFILYKWFTLVGCFDSSSAIAFINCIIFISGPLIVSIFFPYILIHGTHFIIKGSSLKTCWIKEANHKRLHMILFLGNVQNWQIYRDRK